MKVLILSLFVSLTFVSFANAQESHDQSADQQVSIPQNPLLPADLNIEFIVPAEGQTFDEDFQVVPENIRNALKLRREPAFDFTDDEFNNMRYRILPSESSSGDNNNLGQRIRNGINFDMCGGPWECTFTNRLRLRNRPQDQGYLPQPGSRNNFDDPTKPSFCYPGSEAPKELCRNSIRGVFFKAVRRF